MPPNPLTVAAYVAGFLLSVPVLVVVFKVIFFLAGATNKLDSVVADVGSIKADLKSLRHTTNDGAQQVELSLFVIETDVNALQEKVGVQVRDYPDRRTGPAERRTA